jgi:hypothetical protein
MIMIYIYTNLHISSSSGSLVTDIKPNAIENIRTAAMLFFHI